MQALSSVKDPVLIVGAGPTGLTLANVLSRYGVPVRIIEKKSALSRHTKATNLMQRNQELIAALGFLEPLDEISGHMRRLMVHAYGKCFGPRTMRLKESPFTDVLLCGQHNFEEAAARALSAAGTEVEYCTELTGLRQDAHGCSATLIRGGVEESRRFAYVAGCDGYAGVTKTFTKLDFKTRKTGVGIRQVDCRLEWRRLSTMEQMWLFYFDQGFAAVVPLPGGIHRLLTIEPKGAFPQREPLLEEMQTKLRQVTDDPCLTLTAPEWFSYTDLSMGHAPALRDGCVLLAGDAGNPVLPNGGQGMNTGIADGFNLGWKLAAVYKHGGPDELLNSYNEERHTLRLTLEKAQFNSLKYTTLITPKVMQAAFRAFAEPLLNHGGEYKMAQAFSELTIDTRSSPLTLELAGRKGVRAGDRALDAAVVRAGRSIRLYELIYLGSWTILAFGGTGHTEGTFSAAKALEELQGLLPVFVIASRSRVSDDSRTLYDLDEEAHRVYCVTRPTLYLIRPDGHIGARVPLAKLRELHAYLDRWIPDGTQRFGLSIGSTPTMRASEAALSAS